MPVIQDHPFRLRRIRAGISQADIAATAKVSRATVSQLEEGRIVTPNAAVLGALSARTATPMRQIAEEIEQWQASRLPPLTVRAQNALALPAAIIAQYPDFTTWREDVAPNVTAFASLLRVPRNTIDKYERGLTKTFPKPLLKALYDRLSLPDDYVGELLRLPHGPADTQD